MSFAARKALGEAREIKIENSGMNSVSRKIKTGTRGLLHHQFLVNLSAISFYNQRIDPGTPAS